MPKVILTPEVLKELSGDVKNGRMNKLKISRYKSGAKAGQLFAEYSLRTTVNSDPTTANKRMSVAQFLDKAAGVMASGELKEVYVLKVEADGENYVHSMAVNK